MTSITMANPIAQLEKAFRRKPDAPLFARLADLYIDGGQTERALSLCEEGCANFPDYSTGFVVLSKCYEDQGDVEKAREAMDHALRLDPENPGSYKRISDLFQRLGVARLALQTLQQAAYFDPFDDTLNEQIDKLTYTARKDATEDDPSAEVTPLPEVNKSPVVATSAEALIAGAPKLDPVNEVAEPFAQVQDLPEWSDSPDAATANPPPAAEVNVDSADEITAETEVSSNEKAPASPFVLPDTDGDEEEEGASTEANGEKEDKPQVESWIRFSEQGKKDKDSNPYKDSIFSPEVLPEDSDIFKPQELPYFSVPATPTEYASEPEPSAIEGTAESSADEPDTKMQEAATDSESGVQEVVESPVAATEADEQEIVESLAAETELETPTPFLMSNLTEETPSSATPPPETEPASYPTFAPDATASAQGSAENENYSLANLAPDTVDGGDSTSSTPFFFGNPSAANDPETTSSEEPEDLSLDDIALHEVAAKADKHFLFDSGTSANAAQDETPDIPEPTEPITDSASPEESPSEPTSVENIASFADHAPTEEATTGTSSLFLSSSDTETTESSAASDAKEPPAPSDDHSTAQNNPELLRLFQEIEQEPEPEPEPVFEQPKPLSALKRGHPEDKRIATMTLAEIYTIQGLKQKAIETYRELLELDPSNTIIRSKLESLEKSSDKQ